MYLAIMTCLKVLLNSVVEIGKPEMSPDLSFNSILSCMGAIVSY